MAMSFVFFILSVFVLTLAYHPGRLHTTNLFANATNISHEQRYQHYLYFSKAERLVYREKAREMFQFAYDSYMTYAFPQDELDPIHCRGRGPDVERP